MFKLYKDNKKIENVKIDNLKFKLLNSSRITIFSTFLGLSLISGYKQRPNEIAFVQYNLVGTNATYTSIEDVTYEDIIKNECTDIVKNYAYVFNLKDEVLLNSVYYRLDEVDKDNLRSNYNILNTDKKYDSLDIQIILIAKDLINNPSYYGYNSENIYLEEKAESNLTIREMVYKYADAFNLDRDLMLAIPCAESGYFKESIATKNHNPYSCRGKSGKFITYDNLERGILEGELNLKQNYFDKGLTTKESFAKIYCPEETSHWLYLVNNVSNNLENGKKLYDEESKELVLK